MNGLDGGRTAWQPPAVQQVIDLPDEKFMRGCVDDSMIRDGALPGQGQLRRFALLHLLHRPAASVSDPSQADFRRGIDEDEVVAHVGPAGLQQEGRVDYEQ